MWFEEEEVLGEISDGALDRFYALCQQFGSAMP